jgi:hypothetical protein
LGLEIAVIDAAAAGELLLALGGHARRERIRDEPDITMSSLLQRVARSYRAPHTL